MLITLIIIIITLYKRFRKRQTHGPELVTETRERKTLPKAKTWIYIMLWLLIDSAITVGIIFLAMHFILIDICNSCACNAINAWNDGDTNEIYLINVYNNCIPKMQLLKACSAEADIFILKCEQSTTTI
jgi:hypothetical protein